MPVSRGSLVIHVWVLQRWCSRSGCTSGSGLEATGPEHDEPKVSVPVTHAGATASVTVRTSNSSGGGGGAVGAGGAGVGGSGGVDKVIAIEFERRAAYSDGL